jgi:CBS domain-containing protein
MVERIASILPANGPVVHSVSPDVPVYDALVMMASREIAAVLVIEQGELLGIVSAKDYATKIVLQGKNGRDVLTREVMTTPVVTVAPEVKIVDAMQIMISKKFRHLPVFENGELVGVVTLAELVRAILADQTFQIDQLMKYIGHR